MNFILGPIIEALKGWGASWLETRKIKEEGKIKLTQAKVDGAINLEKAKSQMDVSAQDGMRYSWKDEFWSIVFGGILICCFLPWTQEYIKTGFIFLKDNTPGWFEWGLLGIIAASFGLRTWTGWKK